MIQSGLVLEHKKHGRGDHKHITTNKLNIDSIFVANIQFMRYFITTVISACSVILILGGSSKL